MQTAAQVERIISDIEILDYWQKIEILEQLVHSLKKSGTSQLSDSHSLLELQGLGKEIWKNVNVDEYIDNQRNSWS